MVNKLTKRTIKMTDFMTPNRIHYKNRTKTVQTTPIIPQQPWSPSSANHNSKEYKPNPTHHQHQAWNRKYYNH